MIIKNIDIIIIIYGDMMMWTKPIAPMPKKEYFLFFAPPQKIELWITSSCGVIFLARVSLFFGGSGHGQTDRGRIYNLWYDNMVLYLPT